MDAFEVMNTRIDDLLHTNWVALRLLDLTLQNSNSVGSLDVDLKAAKINYLVE